MWALKWRQKHKHYYKCINSFKSMIWCCREPQLGVRLLRGHPFSTFVHSFDVNLYPVILRRHCHYQVNNIFIAGCMHLARHLCTVWILKLGGKCLSFYTYSISAKKKEELLFFYVPPFKSKQDTSCSGQKGQIISLESVIEEGGRVKRKRVEKRGRRV